MFPALGDSEPAHEGTGLAESVFNRRIKTYLFGVAIGTILVGLILMAKASQQQRQRAAFEAQAAERAAAKQGTDSGR